MFPIVIVLLAAAAAVSHPFQITTNKPFVPVTVEGSAPLWFILDSGNNGGSIIARECPAPRRDCGWTTRSSRSTGAERPA
jgi:hypothetical protein